MPEVSIPQCSSVQAVGLSVTDKGHKEGIFCFEYWLAEGRGSEEEDKGDEGVKNKKYNRIYFLVGSLGREKNYMAFIFLFVVAVAIVAHSCFGP